MKKILILLLISISSYASGDSIVYKRVANAISKLETGHFKSKLCKKYHNYFGFKVSGRKINIAKTKSGYAIYKSKEDSYLDYYYFEKKLIKKYNIVTEKQFLYYIKKVYAKDIHYIKKIKKLL